MVIKELEKNMKKQQNYNLDDYFKNAFDEQDKVAGNYQTFQTS